MAALSESAIIKIIMDSHHQLLPAGSLGCGDDAAFVPLAGGGLVTSTDMLVEGEDFSLDWASGYDIGHKSLAVNISDLAAMGSRPAGYLLSLALPAAPDLSFVKSLADGMAAVAAQYNCPLYGGDLSATSGPLTINIVVFGERQNPLLCRGGAAVGDDILVAGQLGGAAAGLHILQHCPQLRARYPQLVQSQLRPAPLLEAGLAVAGSGLATSMMDISDGVASDLPRLLSAGLGAVIEEAALPLVPGVAEFAAANDINPVSLALRGGEDYGLLFTAPPDNFVKLQDLFSTLSCPVSKIGRVTSAPECYLITAAGKTEPLAPGFDHFG